MESKNPNPYPEKFDINLLKNPFQCRKCKQLPLMAYTYQLPGEIKCKCLCGYEWITSVYNLLGYTHLENVMRTSASFLKNPKENAKEKESTQSPQNNEDIIKRCDEISKEIVAEWNKIIEQNPKFLIEKFKINFNLKCKKHQVISNQYFCKTCMMPLCERCRRIHLEHEIEEPPLNDNEKITQLLIKSIQPFKKGIEQPLKSYNDLKTQVENHIKNLKSSKAAKTDEKNTDLTKLDEIKSKMYYKCINQLISNELIFLFAQINIAVLKLSLPNPNFVVLHNAANTTEFNFSQIKQLNPDLNGKEILKYSEQFLNFFTSKYLVGSYDDTKTTLSNEKRINDLPFNLKQIKKTEVIPFSNQPNENHKVNYVLALHDGKIAVCCSDSRIKIFNSNNQMDFKLEGHKEGVNWLISSSQSELISCSDDNTIRKWKIERGTFVKIFSSCPYKCENVYEGHQKKIVKIDYFKSDKDKIISCSKDGTMKKWNLKEKKNSLPIDIIQRNGLISFIQLDPKIIITTSDDGIVNLWEQEKGDKGKFKKSEKHMIKNVHCFSTGSLSEFGSNFILVGEQKYVVVINYKLFEIYEKIENPELSNIACFLNLNPASCIVCGFNKFWILQFEELIFEIKEIKKEEEGDLSLFTSLCSLGGNALCSTNIDGKIIKWTYE